MYSRPFLIRSLLQGGEGPVHLMPQAYGCPKERKPADEGDLFLKSQRDERREELAFFKKNIHRRSHCTFRGDGCIRFHHVRISMQYTVRNPLALAYEPVPVRLICEITASSQDARLPEELVFGNKEFLQLDARGMIVNIIGDVVREEHVSLNPRLREDPMQPERLENRLEPSAKRQLVVGMHYHCQQLGVTSLDLCPFFQQLL